MMDIPPKRIDDPSNQHSLKEYVLSEQSKSRFSQFMDYLDHLSPYMKDSLTMYNPSPAHFGETSPLAKADALNSKKGSVSDLWQSLSESLLMQFGTGKI